MFVAAFILFYFACADGFTEACTDQHINLVCKTNYTNTERIFPKSTILMLY